MNMSRSQEGSVNPLVISNVLLALLTIVFGGVMVWALVNYTDQKDNTDTKIAAAVAVAKKEQSAEDEKNFLEREKAPFEQYVGSDDLGRVTFNYPKTWSVYQAKLDSGGLEAYFNPGIVQSVSQGRKFSLEAKVIDRSSSSILAAYEQAVKKGDLKSSQVVINGFSGTRLDGSFSKDIKGSMVVFKVRDKALVLSTDAESFRADFDDVVLKSLDFNP